MATNIFPDGRPRGNDKRDYVIYTGAGRGSSGGVTPTGVTQQSYWVDLNPFATKIRRLVVQNTSFEVYSSTDGSGNPTAGSEVPLYIRGESFNDCPPEIAMSSSEVAAGRTILMNPSDLFPNGQRHVAPYYINTKITRQPSDPNYQTDQGYYAYAAYSGNGFNLNSTGGYNAIWQSFIPQSPLLTSVILKNIFRAGSTSDHTLYGNVYVDVYDSSYALVAHVAALKPTLPLTYTDGRPVAKYNSASSVTADDGVQYYTTVDGVYITPAQPIALNPGKTYYLVFYNDNVKASPTYAVGTNVNPDGSYNGRGRYPFGQAYSQTGSMGSPTLSSAGTNKSVCFMTQRNVGRICFNFYWTSGSYYWYNPATFLNQFKYVTEDIEQRI